MEKVAIIITEKAVNIITKVLVVVVKNVNVLLHQIWKTRSKKLLLLEDFRK
jgi:hypothetical protein